ncbi:MAG: hypothetical protein UZ12_BCD005000340 [Bacteroidetes bacterium OLB12]|nr:MAG: hypothetical protein UZ12_BCD005000340 [Bacteroidetes bacterium OLB12]
MLPTRISRGVCAFKYNLAAITTPAIRMAAAVGHNKSGCSTALFNGSRIPILPQAASACTLTFTKKLSTTAATTNKAIISNK